MLHLKSDGIRYAEDRPESMYLHRLLPFQEHREIAQRSFGLFKEGNRHSRIFPLVQNSCRQVALNCSFEYVFTSRGY